MSRMQNLILFINLIIFCVLFNNFFHLLLNLYLVPVTKAYKDINCIFHLCKNVL